MLSSVPAARLSSLPPAMVAYRAHRPTTCATTVRSPPPSPPAVPCECILLRPDISTFTDLPANLPIIPLPHTLHSFHSVTSVGSTQGINPETAAPFSSGGFSNIFAQPDYQSSAVAAFLSALGNTNAGRFNAQGRAFPDVSTQGVQFLIDVGGRVGGVDGTSASSPTFASVVALLNDARLNLGMAPLGFLNPFLYSQGAAALNDITEGSNPGCGTDGFPAVPGWDPVRRWWMA